MSIFGKSGGAKVSLVPRVKHNGVIKIPVSGWTKQNGVLKKIWSISTPPTADEVKCEIYGTVLHGARPVDTCAIVLRRTAVPTVPVTYQITYPSAIEEFSTDIQYRYTQRILAADANYSIIRDNVSFGTLVDSPALLLGIVGGNTGNGAVYLNQILSGSMLAQMTVKAYYGDTLIWQDVVTQGYEQYAGCTYATKLLTMGSMMG